jgi:hypothetical protein
MFKNNFEYIFKDFLEYVSKICINAMVKVMASG